MKDNIKLLEDRVGSAVERLRQLAVERDRLETENRELRTRLEVPDGVAPADGVEPLAAGGDGAAWAAQRMEIAARLRQAITELRGD